MSENQFKQWCIVELFGHQKIAGLCSEQNIAGTNMLRVDVPETASQPPFTRIFGAAAIYALNPVDEYTCRVMAESIQSAPVAVWNAQSFVDKFNDSKPALTSANFVEDDDFQL